MNQKPSLLDWNKRYEHNIMSKTITKQSNIQYIKKLSTRKNKKDRKSINYGK